MRPAAGFAEVNEPAGIPGPEQDLELVSQRVANCGVSSQAPAERTDLVDRRCVRGCADRCAGGTAGTVDPGSAATVPPRGPESCSCCGTTCPGGGCPPPACPG